MNNRFSQNIPNLGSVQPAANATETEEINGNSDRQSLIGRNNECVICMDNQRGTQSIEPFWSGQSQAQIATKYYCANHY